MIDSDRIYIDKIPSLPSEEIVVAVHHWMDAGREDCPQPYIVLVANVVGSIADSSVLIAMVKALQKIGHLKSLQIPDLTSFTVTDSTKIVASLCRLQLLADYAQTENERLNSEISPTPFHNGLRRELPILEIAYNDRAIHHNLLTIQDYLQRKALIVELEHANKQSAPERERLIKGHISAMNELAYNHGTALYAPHISRLKDVLQYSDPIQKAEILDDFREVFRKDGFELFSYIMNNYVRKANGRQADIAYFYGRMYGDKNKFIHARPEKFKAWFQENYPDDEVLGKFRTLESLENPNRSHQYSAALDWLQSK